MTDQEQTERKPKTRMVFTGLDPSDGKPRYARIEVEEKSVSANPEVPVPTMDELPPPNPLGRLRGESHASHVAKGLDEAERRRDELVEKLAPKKDDESV